MTKSKTMRVCVDPGIINALQREGIGWGHDLDCGCLHVERAPKEPGVFARVQKWMKRGIV